MECERCGAEAEYRIKGSTQGWYCPRCDWAVVTTYFPPIELDQTIYQVHVATDQTGRVPVERLRVVARLTGLNYIQARDLMTSQPEILVYEGEAPETLEAARLLERAGLRYRISPEFRYDRNGDLLYEDS